MSRSTASSSAREVQEQALALSPPREQLAFAEVVRRNYEIAERVAATGVKIKHPGRANKLNEIRESQMLACEELIYQGVTPSTAGIQTLNISANTFKLWMDEGSKTDSPPLQRAFNMRVRRAMARARAVAETRVFAQTPDTWLIVGPAGRSEDEEQWVKPQPTPAQQNTMNLNLYDVRVTFGPRGAESRLIRHDEKKADD